MADLPALTGTRVRLRPWRADDADDVYVACQDLEIQRFTTVPSPYRRADAEDFLRHRVPATAAAGGAPFAVEPLGGSGLVASMTLLHVRDGAGEIGYWCAPWGRGRGYVTDALEVLCTWAFATRDVERLELIIEPVNAASRGVARRAGFVPARPARPDELRGGIKEATVHVRCHPAASAS